MSSRYPELRNALGEQKRPSPRPLPRPTLGQRVQAVPCAGTDSDCRWGTVTYIHDTHYWYTVTFDAGYRQCYQWGCTR